MFRNREVRKFAVLFLVMTAVTTGLGFAINMAAGILAAVAAAAFGTAFFLFTRARYQNIARISDQIDLVLHNAERLYIEDADEGELSILSSEITKMTQRIREQNDALRKEKEHLAESLADIAHQLRTPLTSTNLILSLLASHPEEAERKAFIREAEELLVRMDWLLTSLLKLSRLDAGIVAFQSVQVDIESLISAAIRPLMIPMDLHDIAFEARVPEGAVIQGDSDWLSEAIQNILKNCMESVGSHGKIELVCEDTPLFTEIIIHDSGSGFQEEDLPHLFDRFYRGKQADTAGYGIGLALSKMIITRQGGMVMARNHPQGGAVFALRFSK